MPRALLSAVAVLFCMTACVSARTELSSDDARQKPLEPMLRLAMRQHGQAEELDDELKEIARLEAWMQSLPERFHPKIDPVHDDRHPDNWEANWSAERTLLQRVMWQSMVLESLLWNHSMELGVPIGSHATAGEPYARLRYELMVALSKSSRGASELRAASLDGETALLRMVVFEGHAAVFGE